MLLILCYYFPFVLLDGLLFALFVRLFRLGFFVVFYFIFLWCRIFVPVAQKFVNCVDLFVRYRDYLSNHPLNLEALVLAENWNAIIAEILVQRRLRGLPIDKQVLKVATVDLMSRIHEMQKPEKKQQFAGLFHHNLAWCSVGKLIALTEPLDPKTIDMAILFVLFPSYDFWALIRS